MGRALAAAVLSQVFAVAAFGQSQSLLHIRVTLVDAAQQIRPVPRYALLISDNPPSAAPRLVVTGLDGTADVRVKPGSYIVESDKPVALEGKAYEWIQVVEVAAGRDAVLELTAANAEAGPMTSAATGLTEPLETDPLVTLQPFQDSVVALWSPTARASGFVVDGKGLIVTNQRIVGTASSIEVQLTPVLKVPGRVIQADADRDVAVVAVDPSVIASLRPVPPGCAVPARPTVSAGQKVFTIGSPIREPRGLTPGSISRVEARATVSDFSLAEGSVGGPVFTADGAVAGITTADEPNNLRREQIRVVGLNDVCAVLAAAEKKASGTPPNGTNLPVEPARPFPAAALEDAAKRRAGSVDPYMASSSDFDIAFITPVVSFAARQRAAASRSGRAGGARAIDAPPPSVRAMEDFGNWSSYVEDLPPVLLVRVTPRLVEGFWTTVARGAAMTQGINVPSIKRFKSGFSNMSVLCGANEVTPIHPFKIEHRLSETEVIIEGLYVFDPGALGPHCASVSLVLSSEKAPGKSETRAIDPKLVEQVWQDFAAYRDPGLP
jgi:S1-C subfamily serine protease